MKKVMVGISGGVDSATSCLVLKEMGYDVAGVNINFIDPNDEINIDAKEVCKTLNIPFFHFDLYNDFKDKIIKNFYESYNSGKTPNPCILCNKYFKFGKMLEFALNNGYEYIATGHYAKVEYSDKYGRYILRKANNLLKDQSYFLYQIPRDALSHVIFPLEEFDSKEEVRNKAKEANLGVSQKKDSLDICFIPTKDYKKYLIDNNYVKPKTGNIVLSDGKVLGKHSGLFNYTIGQRKGLGVSYSEPLFVLGFDFNKNNLIVGTEKELYKKEILVSNINLLLFDRLEDGLKLNVRIRYQGKDNPATLYNDNNKIRIIFDEGIKSPTPGQSAVFYLDDIVVGGGIIE